VAVGVAAAFASQVDWSRDDGRETIVIGTKQFSEQLILGRLVGDRLREAGYNVEYREGLGSAVVAQAVANGSIDLYFDYTGTIWANQMKRTDNPGRNAMYNAIVKWEREKQGTRVLGKLGFENAYAFAMREDRAKELGITTIADLARAAPRLVAGGDPEWFERPEWFAVRDVYGLKFARQRNFSPTFMYDALRSDEADVITAYTSDGRISADRLRVLEDPREALPSYDTLIILSPERANDEKLIAALRPLLGSINVENMREANFSVDRTDGEKKTPAEAARALAKASGQE